MRHKLDSDSRLVRGLVLDHGSRHPGLPKRLENCFILPRNISLEDEKCGVVRPPLDGFARLPLILHGRNSSSFFTT